ncbi:MAG: hypothetical protein KAS32_11465 [Candidatus Peribacteraceae bacterium]|nr:hypothetical protein [Candidatus Peribacteraceae bacterium]
MAGMILDNQRAGTLPGGLRIECGDFTNSGDGTVFLPTGLTKLLGGLAVGDLTDPMAGRAVSICEGPTIRMAFNDSTGSGSIAYIAFGW